MDYDKKFGTLVTDIMESIVIQSANVIKVYEISKKCLALVTDDGDFFIFDSGK